MEDLYDVLKMMYTYIDVISRQKGMYICRDDKGYRKSTLYINNKIYNKDIDIKTVSFGKSWFVVLYRNNTVEIFSKLTGKVLKTINNVEIISKNNIYNNEYSVLNIETLNDKTLLILNNKEDNIEHEYHNISNINIDSRASEELTLTTEDKRVLKICNDMRGVYYEA